MDPFKLVDAAIDLVRSGISGNTIVHEHMKRAASTLYYAVFHCLAKSNADVLAGIGGGDAWTKVYRYQAAVPRVPRAVRSVTDPRCSVRCPMPGRLGRRRSHRASVEGWSVGLPVAA